MDLKIQWECDDCGVDNTIPITGDMIEFTPATAETRDCPGHPASADIDIEAVELRKCGRCPHVQKVIIGKGELEARVAAMVEAEQRDKDEAEEEDARERQML